MRIESIGQEELRLIWTLGTGNNCTFAICCLPDRLEFTCHSSCQWGLILTTGNDIDLPEIDVHAKSIAFIHNGFGYRIKALAGTFQIQESGRLLFLPDNGRLTIQLGE